MGRAELEAAASSAAKSKNPTAAHEWTQIYLNTRNLQVLKKARDDHGYNCLHWVCNFGHMNLARFLLTNPDDVQESLDIYVCELLTDADNFLGHTPLHKALLKNQIGGVRAGLSSFVGHAHVGDTGLNNYGLCENCQ